MIVQAVTTAKYMQVIDWVKHSIQNGSIRPGDRLPSESELCTRFGVSRTAVRQALTYLSREGLVESRKGVGSFCTTRRSAASADLAFICYFTKSYIFPRLVAGFERAAQRAGCHMIINQSDNDLEKERSILLRLREKGVAGIAVIPINFGGEGGTDDGDASTNRQMFRDVRDSGIPVVLLDNEFGDESFPSILMDDVRVGQKAAAYFAERGHRDVGMIYAKNHKPFRRRRDGFIEELARRGIPMPKNRILELDKAADHGPALEGFIGGADRPSAVFCANDEIAISLYQAASGLGLKIPEDISVIGVDNSDYAVLPGIGLTSIDHPSAFIGEKAAELLLEAQNDRGVRYRNSIVIDPMLVERSSVRTMAPDGIRSAQ